MLIVDDILFSPVKGFMWIMKELHKAATAELESEADRITQELSNLYLRLETGELSEDEFDERETELLDRLDQLRGEIPEEDEDDFEDTYDTDLGTDADEDEFEEQQGDGYVT